MNEDNNLGWGVVIGLLIIAFFIGKGSVKYEGLTAEEWFDEYDYSESKLAECEEQASDYEYALDKANSNIEDAKYYAWEDYYDMGYALEDLETVSY